MRDDDDHDGLGNFEPLDHPVLQKRLEDVPLHPPRLEEVPLQQQQQQYSPYQMPPPPQLAAPAPLPSDRWMEKMNYIIHLLEQQQNEKTSHITEEFVLYAFLGVFVIFVVDAFSRGGKYVR
jgi:hypothetical protein